MALTSSVQFFYQMTFLKSIDRLEIEIQHMYFLKTTFRTVSGVSVHLQRILPQSSEEKAQIVNFRQ